LRQRFAIEAGQVAREHPGGPGQLEDVVNVEAPREVVEDPPLGRSGALPEHEDARLRHGASKPSHRAHPSVSPRPSSSRNSGSYPSSSRALSMRTRAVLARNRTTWGLNAASGGSAG